MANWSELIVTPPRAARLCEVVTGKDNWQSWRNCNKLIALFLTNKIQETLLTNLKKISAYRGWVAFFSLLLAMVLASAACTDSREADEGTALPTVTVTTAETAPEPTSVPTAAPTIVPVSTQAPAEQATPEPDPVPTLTSEEMPVRYPVQIRDMLGRPVEIGAKPVRIASISPTATEMLYAAGGTAVARDTGSTFPEEVMGLPELGGAYSPSFEAIAVQRPDLIVMEGLSQGRFLGPLSELGVPVVAVRAASLEDVVTGIRLLGQIIGKEEMANQAAEELVARVERAIEDTRAGRSALALISDADRNLYVAKPQSYPGAITGMVQLLNPAAGLPDSGTFPGFAQVSVEQLLTMDPDYLFTITPAPEPAPRLSVMLPRIPGFSSLRAIREGQMHEIDP